MSSIKETAAQFFEASETGKGWAVCSQFCHPNASFSCQADALAEIDTLEGYTEWVKGLQGPMPGNTYDLKSFGADEDRSNVSAYAVFRGTHTGDGGPVPPTGKSVETDYVYVMQFEDGRVRHMTKIWNDGYALKRLGWG